MSDEWTGWIAALFGLWVLVSPFVLSGPIGSGIVLVSNVVSGIVVLVLAAYAAYAVHVTRERHRARWTGGVAALFGLLVQASRGTVTYLSWAGWERAPT